MPQTTARKKSIVSSAFCYYPVTSYTINILERYPVFLYIVGCTKFHGIMSKLTAFEASLCDLKKKKMFDALTKEQKRITLVTQGFRTWMFLYFRAHVPQTEFS